MHNNKLYTNRHTASFYGPNQPKHKKIEAEIPIFQVANDSDDTENYTRTTNSNATSSQAQVAEKSIEQNVTHLWAEIKKRNYKRSV